MILGSIQKLNTVVALLKDPSIMKIASIKVAKKLKSWKCSFILKYGKELRISVEKFRMGA